ncbi:hypothetical protein RHMOL_Rhmol03G0112500 [Rhododendron molle]|uniref:Uncharacterized protein n=1 Tax=Rhododendron molle TaxID=49168 RepID=A0ACC0PE55_RHOML|nr:hypothetical protein RHMOL_Rhmol03G0112500 [Rhododendron molle]
MPLDENGEGERELLYMVYRALSYGLSPMVPVHVRWRRVRGLEHPLRGPDGLSRPSLPRPAAAGPLIWILSDEHEDTKVGILGTPMGRNDTLCPEPLDSTHKANGNSFSSAKPPESVTPFGQRKSKFVVQSTLNDLPNAEIIERGRSWEFGGLHNNEGTT